MAQIDQEPRPHRRPPIPRGIWALGFVSLFMDVSSEMIHALLPVFLVTVLGASTLTVGVIEGVGEATASGWLSDRLGKRKLLTVIGYGLGTLSKPLFALAPAPSWVLLARFSDRVGKGIRGAPRDALIGDIAPPAIRGAAYGLRQSLDTVGAFLGPLIAVALMALTNDNFRLVFWVALIPGLLCVTTLWLGVREPKRPQPQTPARFVISRQGLKALGPRYFGVVAVGTVLTLARFSEAFLILRAQGAGLSLALVPMVLIVMNIVYAASAYPAGVIADRGHPRRLLVAGFLVLVVADMVLAFAPNIWTVMAGVALWGLHMGMTQSLLSMLIAETAPVEHRGTAFGFYNFVTGLALLLASLIAGLLWDLYGPAATFEAGAAFTVIGLLGFLASGLRQRR